MSNRPRPEDGSPTHVEATQKSIAVLRYLKEEGPATLSELAEALGHSKSTIHRHLRTLECEGFIEETDEGYRVGLLFLDYGVLAQRNHPLYEVAKPKVDELAADTGEKVWCMTEENGLGVFIYHQQGKDVFDTFTRVGYRGRLQDFAAGKAVLAHLPDDRIDSILEQNGSCGQPGNGSTVEKDLREELRRIRERSVAFNRQESHKGVNAVAAPILLGPRNPLGSISIAGPASRMRGRHFETEVPEKLLGITNEIEVQIEYR